jgi:hypothetical protein
MRLNIDILLINIQRVLFSESRYNLPNASEENRARWVVNFLDKFPLERLQAFCADEDIAKLCESVRRYPEPVGTENLVRRFHIATDFLLEDVDLQTLRNMILSEQI